MANEQANRVPRPENWRNGTS